MITFYGYDKCGTCRKAKKVLRARGLDFKDIDVIQSPPPLTVLKSVLQQGRYSVKDLFNKSGEQYRLLNMKEVLPKLNELEALKLLSQNGRLVKRPIVTDGKNHSVGFDEGNFNKTWK